MGNKEQIFSECCWTVQKNKAHANGGLSRNGGERGIRTPEEAHHPLLDFE